MKQQAELNLKINTQNYNRVKKGIGKLFWFCLFFLFFFRY